ncbi:hypothetical protein ACFFGV_14635 [Pontibacillus salicampi]|uniref:Sublancin immunity protein SunI-like PH domain-containing protein n=1 Tax=Pontibacillus salicampi TaxID=1449801 RepID=A0ABV6LQX2_9BACI
MYLVIGVALVVLLFGFLYGSKTSWNVDEEKVTVKGGWRRAVIDLDAIYELRGIHSFNAEKDASFIGFPALEKRRLMIKTQQKNYIVALRSSHLLCAAIMEKTDSIDYKSERM